MLRGLVVILTTILLLTVTTRNARADGDNIIGQDAGDSGSTCVTSYFAEGDTTPSTCEGTVLIWRIVEDLGDNVCKWAPDQYYDCESGESQDVVVHRGALTVEAACSQPGPTPPCGGLVWSDGISWLTEYGDRTCSAWEWRLQVHAGLPCNRLAIYPYPATTVGWPSGFKFIGAGTTTAQAARAYAGAGSPGNPRVGDQRNIVLQLKLVPARNALELYLPRWGRVVDGGKSCPEQGSVFLPPQGVFGRPKTWACWDLPSHPAAGGEDQAGRYFPDDPVGPDAPLFKGWGRVPYYAYWALSYQEYKERTYCDTSYANWGWDEEAGQWVPECTEDGQPGHWETEYYWDTVSRGGVIDPDWVAGLPAGMKADLNGDGDADAFWSYGVQVLRMDENGRLDGWWRKEYVCRAEIPIVVREAQSRIAWPEHGPRVGP